VAEAAKAEVERYRSGNGDAADVNAAHDAVTLEVALAEAGGEKKWAEDCRQDAGDGVWEEEEAVGDELSGVAVGMREDWVLREDKHGDAGECEEGPDGGLGEVSATSGWGRGDGGSRHRCDIRSGEARVVVAGMSQDSAGFVFWESFSLGQAKLCRLQVIGSK